MRSARSDKAWAITDVEVMDNTRKLEKKIAVRLDDRLQKNENMKRRTHPSSVSFLVFF